MVSWLYNAQDLANLLQTEAILSSFRCIGRVGWSQVERLGVYVRMKRVIVKIGLGLMLAAFAFAPATYAYGHHWHRQWHHHYHNHYRNHSGGNLVAGMVVGGLFGYMMGNAQQNHTTYVEHDYSSRPDCYRRAVSHERYCDGGGCYVRTGWQTVCN